jgi:hypothetical protein
MNKMAAMTITVLACGSILILCVAASGQQKRSTAAKPTTESAVPKLEQPIACNVFGLNEQQRKRQQELRKQLFEAGQELRELPDGYAVGLPPTSENILAAAEFVTLERLCCPFFRFELAVRGNDEPIWLSLTGGKDVKAFLKAELLRR